MSSTWYRAVCDEHKVFIDVMVNDPLRSAWLLGAHATQIKRWLIEHYGCELRLVWRDDQLDPLWETHKEEKLPGNPQAEEAKHWTGALCSVCGKAQFRTPSGDTCVNDHGGAPPKDEL